MQHEERVQGSSTVKVDNDRVRITEWSFGPGEETGHHRHETDYIVVPMATGKLLMTDADGEEAEAQLEEGEPYFRRAGVEHNVVNANPFAFTFIEIELK